MTAATTGLGQRPTARKAPVLVSTSASVLEVAAELRRVHAGAERGAGAGEHDAPDAVVAAEALEGVRQLDPQVDRQRVALLRPLQRDQRDPVVQLYREQAGHGRAG